MGSRDMNRFVFANPSLCIGCNTCLAACSEVHEAKGLQAQPRLSIVRNGDISSPIACRHCENAPCAAVCPVDAISMSENAVVLNEAACIGCKLCVFACPFGVIAISGGSKGSAAKRSQKADDEGREVGLPSPALNSASESRARAVAVKCDLCEFSGNGPECVRVCPTEALFLVDEKMLKRSSTAKRKAATSNMPSLDQLTGQKT